MALRHTRFTAMGCPCEIRFHHDNDEQADHLAAACISEARRFEKKYSRYLEDSVTTRINSAAGRHPVDIDPETSALLDYADICFEESDGLFDITSGVLRNVWHTGMNQPPDPGEMTWWLDKIGWKKVLRTPDTVFLPEAHMEIDMGGLVKEYAADAIASLLSREDAIGLVSLGGDIAIAEGNTENPQPWSIGISDPQHPGQVLAMLELKRGAIATSGGYERFFEINGKRYSHLLNPLTGYPTDCLLGVSVVAPQAIVAGSISSIALLQNQQQALSFLAETGLQYLALDSEGLCHGSLEGVSHA